MNIKFQENVPLSKFSNYKIGGPARYFFEAHNLDELRAAIQAAKEQKLRIFILGGGTNLLIDDAGFDGAVIKPALLGLESTREMVRVAAGVLMEDLLRFTIEKGFSGLEWAGGLPGTFGGAVRGNAGAFAGEIKDSITAVQSFNMDTLSFLERENPQCRFGYRSSIFKEKEGREVVVAATLKLKKGDSRKIRESIQEKIDFRRERHPMEYPNIGSIFKNVPAEKMGITAQVPAGGGVVSAQISVKGSLCTVPVKIDPFPVVPAAYLISEAGLKSTASGGAMVSPKHPNFIVNVSNARASDVKDLISLVQRGVREKFGVDLEKEVELI